MQETVLLKDERDGKSYKTINIGNQTWMAENLAFNMKSGCWTFSNERKNIKRYGYMYNWQTAKLACPDDWHLPSDAEWTTLTEYLGGDSIAGTKLKSLSGWNDGGNGTNEVQFNGIAAGSRNGNGTYDYIGKYASWWSSDQSNTSNAWFRFLFNADSKAYRSYSSKKNALYVRCLKD